MTAVAIVAHTSRAERAAKLQAAIGGVVFLDDGNYGAAGNHHRALVWAATQPHRVWIVEDDAVPSRRFSELSAVWAERFPTNLLSGYLGTGHPANWMRKVDEAWNEHADHVRLPQLIHGVCYSVPTAHIPGVLEYLDPSRPADFGIGEAWHQHTGRSVIYPKLSLVDHDDTTPSLANASRPRQPRKARAVAE